MKTHIKLFITGFVVLVFTILALASGESDTNSSSSSDNDAKRERIEEYKNASYTVPSELLGSWIRQGEGTRIEIFSNRISGPINRGPLLIADVTDIGNGEFEFKVTDSSFHYPGTVVFRNISSSNMEVTGGGIGLGVIGSYSRE